MPLTVTFMSSAGELEPARTAMTPAEAATIAEAIIREAGELYPGDKIVVGGEED